MIPYKVIQNIIFLYVWSLTILERIFKQTKKTTQVIVDSFSEETLYFFSDSVIPLIVKNNTSTIITPDLESDCWSFNNNTFVHVTEKECISSRLPYLSASLYRDGVLIGDLSEWLQNINIISCKNIPVRFLVLAWAYQNSVSLKTYSTSKYELQVITMDGDEVTLDIKTA